MNRTPSPAAMRPFGQAADLDLDFGDPDRPGLVTTLLAQCDERRDPAFWWSQPVSGRTAALLRLIALTEQRGALSLNARCVAAACGETFEFELPLQALQDCQPAEDAGPILVRLDAQRSVTIRRPTGADLQRWRERPPASPTAAMRLMLDTLLLEGQASPDDEPALSASLVAADPLVAFTVSCRCPACGAAQDVAVDLEGLALGRLRARQQALLQEVHCLASRYGWTEAEVLAVPPARRARYLALMEASS